MKTINLSHLSTIILCCCLYQLAPAQDATQAVDTPPFSISHASASNIYAHSGLAADPETDATTQPSQPNGNQDYHVRPMELDYQYGSSTMNRRYNRDITPSCPNGQYLSKITFQQVNIPASNNAPIKFTFINRKSGKYTTASINSNDFHFNQMVLQVKSYTCTSEEKWSNQQHYTSHRTVSTPIQDHYVKETSFGPKNINTQ